MESNTCGITCLTITITPHVGNLESIRNQIIEIEESAMAQFSSLEKVTMGSDMKVDISSFYYDESGIYKVQVEMKGDDASKKLTITNDNNYNTLTRSFLETFKYNNTFYITDVVVSENFRSLNNNAFINYSNLKSIDFGENSSITEIQKDSFNTNYLPNLAVYGPTDTDSAIYNQFNKSSGYFSARKTYNDEVNLGFYHIYLNYMEM